MGTIQSSIGLITGIPIQDTVDQLISISARPRDLLFGRNQQIQSQQLALTELSALSVALQAKVDGLGSAELFSTRTVSSSSNTLLGAAVTGDPVTGTYRFTPVRWAQSHQLLSSGIADSLTEAIGAGTLSLRYGGYVDQAIELDQLNGGAGIQRGKIRITDRSGASGVVDLRFAVSVDDVLDAVNNNDSIDVTAEAQGDAIRLVDNTGQTVSNLRVQEVSGGSTAEDLGLGLIDVAADSATGDDVLQLYDNLLLSELNDGNGISLNESLSDLEFTFSDGATLSLDLYPSVGGSNATVEQLLDALNAADTGRLQASISATGDSIELTDISGGGGTFSVASTAGGTAAEDLGVTGAVVGSVISSRRLQSGLKTTLVSSLSGGTGLNLGVIQLTDRSGGSNLNVDLSSAETLQDIVDTINSATGVSLLTRINDARNGIELADTSGGTGSLIVANGDATNSADALGITINDTVDSVNGGSLDRQVVSEATLLDTLNGGAGVELSSFTITDSSGAVGVVKPQNSDAETIGDIIRDINSLGIGVLARINDAGDGIVVEDTASGSTALTITDVGGTSAADLGIAGTADLGTQELDGRTTFTVDITATDTLQDLVDKINALGIEINAATFDDGSGSNSQRLTILSQQTGSSGALLIDSSGIAFDLQTVVGPQDALLLFGSPEAAGAGVLASSSTDTFDGVIPGVSLTVGGTSEEPVTIEVKSNDAGLTNAVNEFIDTYNSLRDRVDALTVFNETDNSVGILFGSNEVLRIENDISRLLTGRFFGVGSIESLEAVGIGINDQGKLSLNSTKLQELFASDPAAVEQFFTTDKLGFANKLSAVIESIAGEDNSLLSSRLDALRRKVDLNNQRIEFLNDRLDAERQRWLNDFFRMESVIAGLQNSLVAISQIQAIAPLSVRSNSN